MDGRVAAIRSRARRRGLRRVGRDHELLDEVRVGLLRPVPRRRRLDAAARRPPELPDGSGQRPRGAARVAARRGGGRRPADGEAGRAVPRRDRAAGTRSTNLPIAAYQVSGEHAAIRFAAQHGALDLRRATLESLVAIRRAGAQVIMTYSAIDVAGWLDDVRRRARGSSSPRPSGTSRAASTRRCGRCARSGASSRCSCAEAAGADVTDADGNRYVDLVGSWGPMIVGHAHPAVVAAVREAMGRGSSFGAPTQGESDLAIRVKRVYPQIERMRFVSSGTEASMSAIRLAAVAHRPREGAEVRRLLPRPRRRAARRGRLRARDARHPVVARRARGGHGRHDRRAVTTTTTRSTARSPPTAPTWPARSSRACPATWASCRRRAGSWSGSRSAAATAGALLRGRRRDERLPRRRRRRRRAVRPRPRPDRARQDRRRRPAGGGVRRPAARSWSCSRRSARPTRPARCPATRWRWPPAA